MRSCCSGGSLSTFGTEPATKASWQELEAVLILEGLEQLASTPASQDEVWRVLDHEWASIVVTDAQLHHATLEPLVSGACHDATTRAFDLPKRLKKRIPRGLTGQVAMLALTLITMVILSWSVATDFDLDQNTWPCPLSLFLSTSPVAARRGHPSPVARAIRNNPAPTTTAPMA